MVKIEGNDITVTRGDTLRVAIEILQNGEKYEPIMGDSIRFALKHRYKDLDPIMIKEIPISTMQLHLEPEDTKPLTMNRTYVYDIQLTKLNGDVDTFISGNLTIGVEVD